MEYLLIYTLFDIIFRVSYVVLSIN